MISPSQRTPDRSSIASTFTAPSSPALPAGAAKWLYHLIRLGVAGIFLWSGTAKLIDPQSFAIVIKAYGLIPSQTVFPAALGLAAAEVLLAIGLILDLRGALTLITLLLLFFMAIIAYGLWLGLDVDCGCFGPDDPEASAHQGLRRALVRDGVMLCGIVYLHIRRAVTALGGLKKQR